MAEEFRYSIWAPNEKDYVLPPTDIGHAEQWMRVIRDSSYSRFEGAYIVEYQNKEVRNA